MNELGTLDPRVLEQEDMMVGYPPPAFTPAPTPTVHPNKKVWADLFWGGDRSELSAKEKLFDDSQANPNNAPLPDVDQAILDALTAFTGSNGVMDHNVDHQKMVDILRQTAAVESAGGRNLEQFPKKPGGPPGPARGAFQVEPATARNILTSSSAYIGPKAERVMGKALGKPSVTKKEILAMSDKNLNDFLKIHEVSAVFAIAKYLAAAKHKGYLDSLR
jgi:hypothetical protein